MAGATAHVRTRIRTRAGCNFGPGLSVAPMPTGASCTANHRQCNPFGARAERSATFSKRLLQISPLLETV